MTVLDYFRQPALSGFLAGSGTPPIVGIGEMFNGLEPVRKTTSTYTFSVLLLSALPVRRVNLVWLIA